MEIFTESSQFEIFIGGEIARVMLQEKLDDLFLVWSGKTALKRLRAFEVWKNQAKDDEGARLWVVILKEKIKKLVSALKKAKKIDASQSFFSWKAAAKEQESDKKETESLSESEEKYQLEIKKVEEEINKLQVRNDDLTRVHAHFLNRENSFSLKIKELRGNKHEKSHFGAYYERKIEDLQEENYSLTFKVKAAEFCLQEFLKSTKDLFDNNYTK